jgi:uncharacterized membrane protein YozB (DUF420 family)
VNGVPFVFGPAVAKAPLGAQVSLVLIIASTALFTIGWRLAVARRYEAHRWVETAAACLNAVVVLAWMIRSFVLYIAPEIPAKLDETSYAVATAHAVVGAIGFVFGMYVVLRGNELVPRAIAFKRYKPFMRSAYALYMLAALAGVILYIVAYVGT